MATEEIIIVREENDTIIPVYEYTDTVLPVTEIVPDRVAFINQSDKDKLDGLSVSGAMNVQSDWHVEDESSWAYIKNKPIFPDNIQEEIDLLSQTVTAHILDKNNPHDVELSQLKDVLINEVKQGDMLIFQEINEMNDRLNNKWINTNETTITDGGNF